MFCLFANIFVFLSLTRLIFFHKKKILPFDHPEYTAYVRRLRQPDQPIVPSFGCENYGVPVVRRNAEAWRHFDVEGLIGQSYSGRPVDYDAELELGPDQVSEYETLLRQSDSWVDDDDCSARIVFINGRRCPALSKYDTNNDQDDQGGVTMTKISFDPSGHVDKLTRLPDGFTDELCGDSLTNINECGTNLLSKLSGPHHDVGKATSQFAINVQQGMASFAALNTVKTTPASLVVLEIPSNVVESKPIVVIHALDDNENGNSDVGEDGTSVGFTIHPRTVLVGHANSSVSLWQSVVDLRSNSTTAQAQAQAQPILHNGYTQLFLEENATVDHTYVEETGGFPADDDHKEEERDRPGTARTHLETLEVQLIGKGATYRAAVTAMGGCGRSKVGATVTLLSEDCAAEWKGLSVSGGSQNVDVRTTLHHVAHGTRLQQQQRTIVGGSATATFKGRIRVEQSAQQTEAQQLARTLLLGDERAKVWMIPSLEIIADDVTCTHGATVADLSEEAMFYLKSRGLTTLQSRQMLMYAFADDVLSTTSTLSSSSSSSSSPLFSRLKERIRQRLQHLVPRKDRAVMGEFSSI